ncbi:hypothetical protein P7C70_g7179, partial [Phenoliferia sp. Uapishka_3]
MHKVEAAASPLLPPAAVAASSAPSNASSAQLRNHHLPNYDRIATQLESRSTPIQFRDEEPARPTKLLVDSASAGSTALSRLATKPSAAAPNRSNAGLFTSFKKGAGTSRKGPPKTRDFTLFLLPDISPLMRSQDYSMPICTPKTYQIFRNHGWIRSVKVDVELEPFGIGLCREAAEKFKGKYETLEHEDVPRFILLQIVGETPSGRTPFRGTIEIRRTLDDRALMLHGVQTVSEAAGYTVAPKSLLGESNVIAIARPNNEPIPWPEFEWNFQAKEERVDEGGYLEELEDEDLSYVPRPSSRRSASSLAQPEAKMKLPSFRSASAQSTSTSNPAVDREDSEFHFRETTNISANSTTASAAPPLSEDGDDSSIELNPTLIRPTESFLSNCKIHYHRIRHFASEPWQSASQSTLAPSAPIWFAKPTYRHLKEIVNGKFQLDGDEDVDDQELTKHFVECVYRLFPKRTQLGGSLFEPKALLAVAGGRDGVKMIARHLVSQYDDDLPTSFREDYILRPLAHLDQITTTYRMLLNDMDWMPGSAGRLAAEVERARTADGGAYEVEGTDHIEHPSIHEQRLILHEIRKEVRKPLEIATSSEVRSKVRGWVEHIISIQPEDGYFDFAFELHLFVKHFLVDGDRSVDYPGLDDHPGFRDLIFQLCESTQIKLSSHLDRYNIPPFKYRGFDPFFMGNDYYLAQKGAKAHNRLFVWWGAGEDEKRKAGAAEELGEAQNIAKETEHVGEGEEGKIEGGDDEPADAGTVGKGKKPGAGRKRKPSGELQDDRVARPRRAATLKAKAGDEIQNK